MGPALPLRLTRYQMAGFFGAAFVVAAIGVWLILKRGGTLGLDAPDSRRKFHEKPIPRLGGAPIFVTLVLGTLAASLAGLLPMQRWLPLALCNTLIFSVGFIDDLKPLGAKVKLVGQIGASLILYSMGESIDVLSNPFGEGVLELGWWSLLLTLFWLVAIPNIVNLIDGMDGLAGGFGMFLCLTVAFIGHYQDMADVEVISLVMAGALGGFLLFNLPPAKIFLGDGGAYLIGFFVASVSLRSSNKGSVIGALLVMIIALGVPILDTLFAILRRSLRGVPIFSADAEHIHHRLILLGYSKGRALAAMYAVCAVLSLVGISILLTKGIALPVAGAILFLLALAAARYLGYIRSFKLLRQQIREVMERRRMREYFRARGRILDFEVERSGSLDEFGGVFRYAIGRMGITTLPAGQVDGVEMKLSTGIVVRLWHPRDEIPRAEWQIRVDELSPSLDACLARWGRLPDTLSDMIVPNENTTAPDTPSSVPASAPAN